MDIPTNEAIQRPWTDEEIEKWHHPWCNNFMRPRKGCKSCDGPNGFFAHYPVNKSMDEVRKEHFPNVIPR